MTGVDARPPVSTGQESPPKNGPRGGRGPPEQFDKTVAREMGTILAVFV